MLGDGPLIADVRQEIQYHGLQDRFTLPGWVTPDEVLAWFDKSDILFMPSLSEGLPVVGVQALAKGLAFVVSNIGGFVDIVVNGENGYLVELSRTSEFAGVLEQLLSDRTRLEGFRNASLIRATQFDSKQVGEKYVQILLEE